MTGRLIFLATSHRVAPGLLTWPAWRLLREATVLAGSGDHPQLPYLAETGVTVEVLPGSGVAVARELLERARSGTVVWLAAADGDEGLMRLTGELAAGDGADGPGLDVLHGSYDLPGARLLDLVATMDELRRRCPWDRTQTHRSLSPHLLEEAYEAVEAVETDDLQSLREELGDVLLQVVFHARVAEERVDEHRFTVDDVAAGIVDKLVRRHPHVFGEVEVAGVDDVKRNWEQIKRHEKRRASVVEGVPLGQPALALAHALQRRAARAGVPEDLVRGAAGDDIGGALFTLVARAREVGVDPEAALRQVARDFRKFVAQAEEAHGEPGAEITPQQWRRHWPRQ